MEPVSFAEVLKWSKGSLRGHISATATIRGVSTDSRNIRPGELFIALQGPNFDGHDFVAEAFRKKACAAVVDRLPARAGGGLIVVSDTLQALGDISRGYRSKFPVKVLAVTGSSGKTTTKDLIRDILSGRYSVAGTRGNLNNQIGLPLSLFSISRRSDFCVVEMGMNKAGEIDYLSRIARPDVGVITNVGYAHIGFFKRLQDIAESKGELLGNLQGEKQAVLNRDSPFFSFFREAGPRSVTSFGLKKGADFQGILQAEHNADFTFTVRGGEETFRMNFWNPAWIYTGLVGIACGTRYGVARPHIRECLESCTPQAGRGCFLRFGSIEVIDESYNSNPDSLKSALVALSRKQAGRRIAVLGDMAELGRYSFVFHYNIGRLLNSLALDMILTLGPKTKAISRGLKDRQRLRHFRNPDQLNAFLRRYLRKQDLVLVKGSRIMRLERVVSFLRENYGV